MRKSGRFYGLFFRVTMLSYISKATATVSTSSEIQLIDSPWVVLSSVLGGLFLIILIINKNNKSEAEYLKKIGYKGYSSYLGAEKVYKDTSVIITYRGHQIKALRKFKDDAIEMASQGYYPISQVWTNGSWGFGAFLVAFLLCFLIIGFIFFIYMIIVKPEGRLSVVYELRKPES